jgi:hypothetical protein
MIVMPQWNADAFSHNVLCEMFNRFGISCLRLSKPYHDVRRPKELERSDYAVSANVGRTIAATRQAVADWHPQLRRLAGNSQGYDADRCAGTPAWAAPMRSLRPAMDARRSACARSITFVLKSLNPVRRRGVDRAELVRAMLRRSRLSTPVKFDT